MNWLGRYLVKRAAWALLAAAVGALLVWSGTARAAEQSVDFTTGAAVFSTTGNRLVAAPTIAGGTVEITVTVGSFAGAGCLKLYVDDVLQTPRSDAGITGCHLVNAAGTHTWTSTGLADGVLNARWENSGNYVVTGGEIVYDDGAAEPTLTPEPTAEPTAEPTPTPSPDPMCDPYCTVALSGDDRARLDALLASQADGLEVSAYSVGAVAFLLSAITVVVGLRR